MISPPIKRKFDDVLRQERLEDVTASFGDADFFDEVPLYSRYQQVQFLSEYGDVNRLLMELAIDYMERVASRTCTDATKRVVAITVVQDDAEEYLVPSIFVCNSNVQSKLAGLHLVAPSTEMGKRIKSIVKDAKHRTLSVLEDRLTVPGDVRIFVSYKSPPCGLASLEEFEN